MRVIDSATQAQLDAGRIIKRGMALLDLPSAVYGFWQGAQPFVHGGVTYQAAGALIEMDPGADVSDGSAVSFTFSMSSIPNSQLSPDVLASFESEAYKSRPARMMVAYIHPDTHALLSVRVIRAGTIDVVEHPRMVGGEARLKIVCESKGLDAKKRGGRSRSHEDQKLILATDRFYEGAAVVASKKLEWGGTKGVAEPTQKPKRKKLLGLF